MVSQRLSRWDWIVTSTDENWDMCLEDTYLAPTHLEWPKTDLRMPRYVLEHNCGCSCGSFCQKSGKTKQIEVILKAFLFAFVPISYETDRNRWNPKIGPRLVRKSAMGLSVPGSACHSSRNEKKKRGHHTCIEQRKPKPKSGPPRGAVIGCSQRNGVETGWVGGGMF